MLRTLPENSDEMTKFVFDGGGVGDGLCDLLPQRLSETFAQAVDRDAGGSGIEAKRSKSGAITIRELA